MNKRFELWAEYQTIMFEPRSFVGCSIYGEKSEEPINEIYLRANLPYLGSEKHGEVGRNLANLVLVETPFLEGDKIEKIRKSRNISRSAGLGEIRVPYTIHRYNPDSFNFEKEFIAQMQASKFVE